MLGHLSFCRAFKRIEGVQANRWASVCLPDHGVLEVVCHDHERYEHWRRCVRSVTDRLDMLGLPRFAYVDDPVRFRSHQPKHDLSKIMASHQVFGGSRRHAREHPKSHLDRHLINRVIADQDLYAWPITECFLQGCSQLAKINRVMVDARWRPRWPPQTAPLLASQTAPGRTG